MTHALQALTSVDEDATVVSIDGVGAFDLMVSGLMAMEHGDTLWPFVRQFYGQPSSHLWEDDCGITHDTLQGEGGEQSDPLMPLLFSLGLHESLTSVSNRLLASERIFAFLDDIYLVCHPERVEAVYEIVRQELRRHANIDIHSGVTPTGVDRLTEEAQVHDPDAIVWRRDQDIPVSQQSMKVLGVPLGRDEYAARFLEKK